MVFDVEKKIAYKCHDCGELHFVLVEPFNINNKNGQFFPCYLGGKGLGVIRAYKDYVIMMECPNCHEDIDHRVSAKNFWKDDTYTAICPECGEYAFSLLSANTSIDEAIEEYRRASIKGLIPKAGEHLRELAVEKHMTCECGCTDISVKPFNKGMKAICPKCGLAKKILIRNYEDAERITEYESLTLKDVRKEKVLVLEEVMNEYKQ